MPARSPFHWGLQSVRCPARSHEARQETDDILQERPDGAWQIQKAGNFLVSRSPSPDFQWTDLEGSDVIGGRLGGMPELVLEYVLRQNGMEPFTDVEIVNNIDFTSTAGAFTGGIGDYLSGHDQRD